MILHHGTTRMRAEAIIRDGPDLDYGRPLGSRYVGGFSMSPPAGPFPQGEPAAIARDLAKSNTAEGGPVILEIDVLDEIAALADELTHPEYRFEVGNGYEELMAIWHQLPKHIIPL